MFVNIAKKQEGTMAVIFADGGIIQNSTKDMNQYHWKLQGEFNQVVRRSTCCQLYGRYRITSQQGDRSDDRGFGYDPNS